MFRASEQLCKLTSVNLRSEIHGAETKPAVDLAITFDTSNTVLNAFGKELRESLYRATKGLPPQGDLAGVEPVSDLPELRNPQIEMPVKLVYEGVGYSVIVAFGTSMGHRFDDCKINNIRAHCKDGGTVSISLRIQKTDPDPRDVGLLGTMIGAAFSVTLTPPVDVQPELAP